RVAGQLIHHLAPIGDPTMVLEVGILRAADGPDLDRPGGFLDRLLVDQKFQSITWSGGEQLPVIVTGLDVLTVDGEDKIAFVDFDVILVGRSVLVDMGDLVETAGVGLQFEPWIAGLIAAGFAGSSAASTGADAGV